MIKHYLKVAFRNLMKYKTQSLVSIIGLAVGFTCFALSVLWIRYEMTYDNFHKGANRIYLVRAHYTNQPGMEALAPERTETRRGFSLSPNFFPVISSNLTIASMI